MPFVVLGNSTHVIQPSHKPLVKAGEEVSDCTCSAKLVKCLAAKFSQDLVYTKHCPTVPRAGEAEQDFSCNCSSCPMRVERRWTGTENCALNPLLLLACRKSGGEKAVSSGHSRTEEIDQAKELQLEHRQHCASAISLPFLPTYCLFWAD